MGEDLTIRCTDRFCIHNKEGRCTLEDALIRYIRGDFWDENEGIAVCESREHSKTSQTS